MLNLIRIQDEEVRGSQLQIEFQLEFLASDILHLLHKHSPYRLTRRKKSGEIVLISKARLIEKLANEVEPTTLRQAMQTSNAENWKQACEEEHEFLLRNKT